MTQTIERNEERKVLAATFLAGMLANSANYGADEIDMIELALGLADKFIKLAGRKPTVVDAVCECGKMLVFGRDACHDCLVQDTLNRA